jgi:4-diphosphocytidyl-2-C-methyl-D-erythritol kinase
VFFSSAKGASAIHKTNEKAYAKLNISLDVLSKRPDGYHELCMVMQTVSLCDDLEVSLRSDGEIKIGTNLRYLPCDERNIAYKAAKAFFANSGNGALGANISITKHIPVCAGMGGGSSDGAAVLRALNRLTGKPFSRSALEELGSHLGSDIPFCVAGGTALASGKGEILSDLTPFPDCFFVIAKPNFSISTPELFSKIDLSSLKYHPDTQGIVASSENGDLKGICRRMYNVFEDVLPQKPDDIPVIKQILMDCGAVNAVMTGTGSAVFGIFENDDKAKSAEVYLREKYKEVFLAFPQKRLEI